MDSKLPLSGLRVLAVEQYGAGPFGTSYLADLGAEVIKIENHKDGGDVGRTVGPHFFGAEDSHFFQTFNRNKKSITLDLKHPDGQAVFQRLAASADAVLDNLRGDLPPKLGLTYDRLKEVNPKIVCTHLSAYGRVGSRTAWPGYDYLMQAETGHLSLTGEPDGPPTRYGLSIVDLMTGLVAAFGLLAGVIKARETGIGMDIDTSLFDVALHNLNYPGTWFLNGGTVTGRTARSGHPSLVPSQLYRTQDGWLFIMCNKAKFWPLLCQELGHPEWSDDPELVSFKTRLANRDRVTRLLDDCPDAAADGGLDRAALGQGAGLAGVRRRPGARESVRPRARQRPRLPVRRRSGSADDRQSGPGSRRRPAGPGGPEHGPAHRCPAARGRLRRGGDRQAPRPRRDRCQLGGGASSRPRRWTRRGPLRRRRPRRRPFAAGVATSALPVTLLVQAAASAAVIAPAIAAPRLLADLALGPVAVGIYIALVYLGAMFASQWGAGWIARLGPIFTSQRSLLFCAVGVMLVGVKRCCSNSRS